ncbi:MAG TPA: hypothetical protein VGN82_16110 [Bosea sp. (in: a-proteobacteria)]|jgi:hypothetical protein|uniref:hypothetical protein n=1 Tax=Bosea sp. (in: a-proteobacteria) TaxID=1871050 RepID=UPI002E15D3E1|nr:hypothetical protein [Bosea sp. (in: a-proteobacteria)]
MFSKGRLIGLGVGLFALICLVTTYDYSRGRVPQTDSPLIADVLAGTTARECGRDATEIVARHLPAGIAQAQAEKILDAAVIVPPRPWFWTPAKESATTWTGDTLEALRTIKTTAFGSNLLRIHLTFADGKLRRLAAEVVCRFG